MSDHFRKIGPTLLANGYLVVPIRVGEKRPAVDAWQKARFTPADTAEFIDHGVGILCGQGEHPVVGVDIDVSHPVIGPGLITWCQKYLGYTGERVGAAPRILLAYRAAQAGWAKGLSVSFFDPTDPVKPSGKKNKQQIEILGNGQQFVAYHQHPDTHRDYEWVDMMGGLEYLAACDLPLVTEGQIAGLLAEMARLVANTAGLEMSGVTVAVNAVDADDICDLMTLSPRVGKTLDEVRAIVAHLDNTDDDYVTWVHVGMSIHHEFVSTPDEADALALWREYGSRSPKDDPKQYDYKWRSFGKQSATPTTLRWLLKLEADRCVHLKYDARAEWSKAIGAASDEFSIREKLCPKIVADTRLDDLCRTALAQELADAFKRLGTKYPIAECKKMLLEKKGAKADGKNNLPVWAVNWVYVTDRDSFFKHDSNEWLTTQGFNAKYTRELPLDDGGSPMARGADYALNSLCIKTVTTALYIPWAPAEFEHNGMECVNTYRPSSAPAPVDKLTPADMVVIDLVTRHIDLLAGGRCEVITTMLDWIAHNVQKPGVKIRWAPLLKGVEGDGKTLIGGMAGKMLGQSNIKNVTPKVLGTDFTGWAEGSCLVVLEEIKLTGHNRHDILNAVKPMITNDSIEVHSKGRDTREVVNTTNYIAFTNHADALPLTDTDRRWWIIFSPFATREQMEELVVSKGYAKDLGGYFDKLHDAINENPAVLRRWFLDYSISPSFRPNGSAPMTEEKGRMVAAGATEEEEAVQDILDNCVASATEGEVRGPIRGVTPTVFSSRCMGDALALYDADLSLNTISRNRLFVKMGFSKLTNKVKWEGEAHRIWVKSGGNTEPNQIRKILLGTLPEKEDDDLF